MYSILSLVMMSPRFIGVVACVMSSFSFYGQVIFHGMNRSHFVYLFISWWIFGLLPPFASRNSSTFLCLTVSLILEKVWCKKLWEGKILEEESIILADGSRESRQWALSARSWVMKGNHGDKARRSPGAFREGELEEGELVCEWRDQPGGGGSHGRFGTEPCIHFSG